jgi:hypothetical protein
MPAPRISRACAASLLLTVCAIAAPQLALSVAAVPGGVEMRVDAAAPGTIVVTFVAPDEDPTGVFGLSRAHTQLVGAAVADVHGIATFGFTFGVGERRGVPFVARAVQLDPTTLATADAVLSPVVHARVPSAGDVADVVVLFGQSNAEGHAAAAALAPALHGAWPCARMWQDATGSFAALAHGVNTRSYGPAAWCGPELGLGRELTAGGRVVHVVKVAAPASTLGPSPGPWNEWNPAAGELHAVLWFRLTSACNALRAQGLRPRVRAVCMMQGESDGTTAALASGYGTGLGVLLATLRDDLLRAGLAERERLQFVVGLVHARMPAAAFPFVATVRAGQRATASTLARVALVETSDLTFGPDGVHFDLPAVLELGRRMGAVVRRAW